MRVHRCSIISDEVFIVYYLYLNFKKKVMDKIKNYLPITTFVLVFLIFIKGCGTGSQVKSTQKDVEILKTKVDSLSNILVTQDEMVKLIKETPNWKTLEIEELSDKNNVPINHYKNELEK
jgi:hypothetical protein